MEKTPQDFQEPAPLKFLRRLVTVLTGVMILGVITIAGLLVMRLSRDRQQIALPAELALPKGAEAAAITAGPGWYAVVTRDSRILIYAPDGTLRQELEVSLP
ncbi:DUF6476 family protein [Mangrovicoccus algicola]|uniref:Uncharacterized protein n=1 Tax=Mangrovicoccus algicola TaxID=2771008 RepID=A0A8J6YZW9_9RHOB|nr:DUF6476 family protein [Mangrovicoccus algicola]MBE3639844.1 hypothetical protein [Mangrovicoccus algicola]